MFYFDVYFKQRRRSSYYYYQLAASSCRVACVVLRVLHALCVACHVALAGSWADRLGKEDWLLLLPLVGIVS